MICLTCKSLATTTEAELNGAGPGPAGEIFPYCRRYYQLIDIMEYTGHDFENCTEYEEGE